MRGSEILSTFSWFGTLCRGCLDLKIASLNVVFSVFKILLFSKMCSPVSVFNFPYSPILSKRKYDPWPFSLRGTRFRRLFWFKNYLIHNFIDCRLREATFLRGTGFCLLWFRKEFIDNIIACLRAVTFVRRSFVPFLSRWRNLINNFIGNLSACRHFHAWNSLPLPIWVLRNISFKTSSVARLRASSLLRGINKYLITLLRHICGLPMKDYSIFSSQFNYAKLIRRKFFFFTAFPRAGFLFTAFSRMFFFVAFTGITFFCQRLLKWVFSQHSNKKVFFHDAFKKVLHKVCVYHERILDLSHIRNIKNAGVLPKC